MNAHLSDILSWLLEPLVNAMMGKSSEVISDEHLKHKIDEINKNNQEWTQGEQDDSPIGESSEMEEKLGAAPGLCGCEECVRPEDSQDDDQEGLQSQAGASQQGEPGQGAHCEGENSQDGANQEREQVQGARRRKSLLLRERREWLKQKRTKEYKRCDKVNSREVIMLNYIR